jgi:hypothetical protein
MKDLPPPLFVAPQILRTTMKDLFPVEDIPDHMLFAIQSIRRRAQLRLYMSVLGNVFFYGVIVLVAAVVLAQARDRNPPLISKVEIKDTKVVAGTELVMKVTAYRIKLCETRVTFVLFDGQDRKTTIETPWQQPKGPLGQDKPFIRPLMIPGDAMAGAARLRIEREFRCPLNFFHKQLGWPITETSPDMPFQITPRAVGAG